MDIEKTFNDLESNQTQECEDAKRKLVELFSQNKEQWLVHYMMDYFHKTGSLRIMEVLVKVQSPHDGYIFDRLAEWLKTQTHRVQALNLFCFVVRKHPTWLFKVEKHRLIKDIFRLLLAEKEIVPFMSALLCIITLLPIIPNLVPNFLNELFEIFGHLASWNCQNPNRLPDDKLVHLQLGLQMLFHRLYGMYPCNFLAYLSDFIKKEKGAIFHHTIKPLLETVRVHPMLVTATTESEVSNLRWKEMEPHDVVVECAKHSLPAIHQDLNAENSYNFNSADLLETPSMSSTRCTPVSNNIRSSSMSGSQFSHFPIRELPHLKGPITRFDCNSNSDTNGTMWSPYNDVITLGPIPLTPTPSYVLPLAAPSAANLNNQLLGVTGSSPPEAAVEATPETTPMKDIKELKHNSIVNATTIANPHAVRAIFATSQPSSPLRKELNQQFHFPDVGSELEPRLITRIATTCDRRVQQVIQDRSYSQSPFQTIEAQAKLGYRSPIDSSLKSTTPDIDTDMSSHSTNFTPIATPTPNPTPNPTPLEHIIKMCDDCNETERSMCTAGGLHIPTSRSMHLFAKGIKRRNRMASYCYNDSSCEKVNASRKDIFIAADTVKVRRTKSCSSICSSTAFKLDDGSDEEELVIKHESWHHDRRLQKSGKMLSIATATKKAQANEVRKTNNTSQTVLIMPQYYENRLYELLLETKELRNAHECNLLQPNEILDQYILRTIRAQEILDQEQHALLGLQLQYERYRREVHAERNRRLMGRSRDKRSLEMERDRLREQLKNFATKNKELVLQIDKTRKTANERVQGCTEELREVKAKYQYELEQNRCLRQANDNLQTRLNEELANRKDLNYELETLRGQIFNMNTELQHAQSQAECGMQCKQELARLEAEFIVMGEVQLKCRDRLGELENYKARDEELQMLQDSYNIELKELKHTLEEKTSQFDSAKHKVAELQTQLLNNEKVITEQKRLLRAVKDEYEENFKLLNKKYDVQKTIMMQMEEKITSLHIPQASNALNAYSPDADKTDVASSMERNSPLSTSLASSESLSASLRSTELRNLQQIVETPITEASSSINVVSSSSKIVEGTRMPTLDLASSAHTATMFNSSSSGANAINITQTASGSSAAAPVSTSQNFDLTTITTSYTHPHQHLQLQQKQQQQQQQKR